MAPSPPVLRIVTWNVLELDAGVDPVGEVLRGLDAHVVALQEAPRRPWDRARCARLAERAGLHLTAWGPAGAGTALLTAPGVHVLAAGVARLPVRTGLERARGTAWARLALRAVDDEEQHLVVASVHLPLRARARLRHAELLQRRLDRLSDGVPVIVAGDLNEPPDGPVARRWGPWVRSGPDAPTASSGGAVAASYPAAGPVVRLDQVLVTGALSALCDVLPTGPALSDHRPVLARVRRRSPADAPPAGRPGAGRP